VRLTHPLASGLLAALLLLPSQSLRAQAALPHTPAGQRFAEWLKMFNDGDRAAVEAYFTANGRNPQMVDRTVAMRRQTGGYDVAAVEDTSGNAITCLLKTRTGRREVRMTLEVAAAEPHDVVSMRLLPVGAEGPGTPAPARMSEADAIAALRAEIARRVGDDQFSGAVMVARDGKPIFAQAYGLADRERKAPNTLDTKFRIGSMNKMFTAVAIAQLVQAGQVKLTEPLGTYLPDYPNRDIATQVTIRELLTHTGGTGDIFGPEFDAHRAELLDLTDYVKLYGKRGPAFAPGSRWEYSNYGFVLLGLVIERVSGQSYYAYVRDHVYGPAGMTASGSQPESVVVPNRSVGYTKMDGPTWQPNTATLPPRPTSAGGGYSTVGDLVAFAQALVGHKLLDAALTDSVTTGKVTAVGNEQYAFGFGDHDTGVRWFGHGGGAPGMNGMLRIYPGSGYVVAVLANLDPPAAEQIAAFIGDRLPAAR
jgi:CubicO group peptidase (beta-lactamase class C family)